MKWVRRRTYDAGRGAEEGVCSGSEGGRTCTTRDEVPRPGGGRGVGRGGSASGMYGVCGPPTEGCGGQRARDERTRNMSVMLVTLDVLKLSGWLKADADCRVKRRAYDMRSEVWAEGGGAWAGGSARAACTG